MEQSKRVHKKQNDIVNAAVSLFLKYGVRKTSMDDIAKKAQASKVTVYKYFEDKDTLCLRVYAHLSDSYIHKLESLNDSGAPLADRMVQFTTFAAEFISSGHQALCDEICGLCGNAYEDPRQKQTQYMMQLIRQGKRERLIQAGLDDEVIFHYIDMGLSYYQANAAYRQKIEHNPRFRERFMTLLWRNIFTGSVSFQA